MIRREVESIVHSATLISRNGRKYLGTELSAPKSVERGKKHTEASATGLEMAIVFSSTPPSTLYLILTEILWLTRILACVPAKVVGRQGSSSGTRASLENFHSAPVWSSFRGIGSACRGLSSF